MWPGHLARQRVDLRMDHQVKGVMGGADTIEANHNKLKEAEFGLYGVVPPHPEYKVITPGVIFCFRQEEPSELSDAGAAGTAKCQRCQERRHYGH
jgi:hypothetical protein